MTATMQSEAGVFGVDELPGLSAFFRDNGFAVLRGLFPPSRLAEVATTASDLQEAAALGRLAESHGTRRLTDDAVDSSPVVHYVTRITEISATMRAAIADPVVEDLMHAWLGKCWLHEGPPFGVVLQDARPGRDSGYARIGWHSDWQSSPHLPSRWPAVAFTLHLDATSPANGFLRVVPGSHLWATPAPRRDAAGNAVLRGADAVGGHTDAPPPFAMPTGFEKVPGEIGVYCEEGDVIFHDSYLWHSAARGTDDTARRRHIRGSWYSGSPEVISEDDFVKNAAR